MGPPVPSRPAAASGTRRSRRPGGRRAAQLRLSLRPGGRSRFSGATEELDFGALGPLFKPLYPSHDSKHGIRGGGRHDGSKERSEEMRENMKRRRDE
eukprot:758247-Hanusia_phi.AAC.1